MLSINNKTDYETGYETDYETGYETGYEAVDGVVKYNKFVNEDLIEQIKETAMVALMCLSMSFAAIGGFLVFGGVLGAFAGIGLPFFVLGVSCLALAVLTGVPAYALEVSINKSAKKRENEIKLNKESMVLPETAQQPATSINLDNTPPVSNSPLTLTSSSSAQNPSNEDGSESAQLQVDNESAKGRAEFDSDLYLASQNSILEPVLTVRDKSSLLSIKNLTDDRISSMILDDIFSTTMWLNINEPSSNEEAILFARAVDKARSELRDEVHVIQHNQRSSLSADNGEQSYQSLMLENLTMFLLPSQQDIFK